MIDAIQNIQNKTPDNVDDFFIVPLLKYFARNKRNIIPLSDVNDIALYADKKMTMWLLAHKVRNTNIQRKEEFKETTLTHMQFKESLKKHYKISDAVADEYISIIQDDLDTINQYADFFGLDENERSELLGNKKVIKGKC